MSVGTGLGWMMGSSKSEQEADRDNAHSDRQTTGCVRYVLFIESVRSVLPGPVAVPGKSLRAQ